ncbi:hypothetical protein [Hymenobacter sp. UYP22]|uniref:hypothetical protein n=1 Tax=Hymenobacter sp. UYP22 TaxID=3156348 RepID=UPI003399050B
MELDDFRRKWQEGASLESPAATTAAELQQLLDHTNKSPLAQLQQAVRRDVRMLWWVSILNVSNVFSLTKHYSQWAEIRSALLVLVGSMILYVMWDTWQRHRIVKGLRTGADTAANQLRVMINKLRRLMNLYTWAGVFFCTSLALCVGYAKRNSISWPPFTQSLDPERTVLACLCLLALGLLIAVGYERQQRRYGQPLRQLEAALRELETVE